MSSEVSAYVESYLDEVATIAGQVSREQVSAIIEGLVKLRSDRGRLFILGVGGSAGNASHAVNDFRKIAGIESYSPSDNVSELTARINDDGWDSCYADWLLGSRLNQQDGLLIFSVGGGDLERRVSSNLVEAVRLARTIGARVYGIVGRDGGYTAKNSDACIVIPNVNADTVTPHAESFQSVVWHLIVSHPALRAHQMKWESLF